MPLRKEPAALEQQLIESGERDRLVELLRQRLIEAGWQNKIRQRCKEVIKERGVENVTVQDLIDAVTPDARRTIPDDVKKELETPSMKPCRSGGKTFTDISKNLKLAERKEPENEPRAVASASSTASAIGRKRSSSEGRLVVFKRRSQAFRDKLMGCSRKSRSDLVKPNETKDDIELNSKEPGSFEDLMTLFKNDDCVRQGTCLVKRQGARELTVIGPVDTLSPDPVDASDSNSASEKLDMAAFAPIAVKPDKKPCDNASVKETKRTDPVLPTKSIQVQLLPSALPSTSKLSTNGGGTHHNVASTKSKGTKASSTDQMPTCNSTVKRARMHAGGMRAKQPLQPKRAPKSIAKLALPSIVASRTKIPQPGSKTNVATSTTVIGKQSSGHRMESKATGLSPSTSPQSRVAPKIVPVDPADSAADLTPRQSVSFASVPDSISACYTTDDRSTAEASETFSSMGSFSRDQSTTTENSENT